MRILMFLLFWALIVGAQGCGLETQDQIDDLDRKIESDIENAN